MGVKAIHLILLLLILENKCLYFDKFDFEMTA